MKFALQRTWMRNFKNGNQRNRCFWCKRTLRSSLSEGPLRRTRDHVIPKSKGGHSLVWCCYACNQTKGSMGLDEWCSFVARNPRYWEDQLAA